MVGPLLFMRVLEVNMSTAQVLVSGGTGVNAKDKLGGTPSESCR